MKKFASISDKFRNYYTSLAEIIQKIFNYLSGYENEISNNRILLRRLYNSGYLDDGKFQDLCEKCSNDNLDPEQLPI